MGSCSDLRRQMSGRLPDVPRPIARTPGSQARFRSGARFFPGAIAGSRDGGEKMNESSPGRNVRQGMDYGETSDVHQVPPAIQRKKLEPRAGLEPLSIW